MNGRAVKSTIKVGVSGVRGVVGESFTPQLACSFARAFGSMVGPGPVLVGRDTRPSGRMIQYAVVAGLQSVGCGPVLAGVVPTPSLLYHTKQVGARGAIAITASHNPPEWNALKFVNRDGLFLDDVHAEELFDIYHQRAFPAVSEPDILRIRHDEGVAASHFSRIEQVIDVARIRDRGFKVAVDCCNGVGAVTTPAFLRERLGCEVVPLFDEPSGLFERSPEPLPENLERLGQVVVENQCAIGFAQDPDGDRLAVVDEAGCPLGEEISVALAVSQVLEQHARGPVVFNLSMSKAVCAMAEQAGSEVILTPTGEIHVSMKILETGAVAGGEHTGGVIVPAVHPCRDSYTGMALILERMALTGRSPAALRAAIPRYALIKEKILVSPEETPALLRGIRRRYRCEKLNLLDGVYVDLDDAWIHVRRSNTEPVLRVLAEAADAEKARRLADEVRDEIERLRAAAHPQP